MELNWLSQLASDWQKRLASGRVPHAVLLLGPAGCGKRSTAVWMAAQRLRLPNASPMPQYPLEVPQHADMRWVCAPADKHTIGVEQIRVLISELNLTSYEGVGKVAVIESAHTMTANAANSLLKTLEEPSGETLLLLIADRVGRLPATIFSRCQRISFNRPSTEDSLQWLDRLQPGGAWPKALAVAAGAPLAAIDALERLADTDAMAQEFAEVARQRAAPLEVAARWARYEPGFVLDWLCTQVQGCIYRVSNSATVAHSPELSESVLHHIDRQNLFCYLDIINRLRAQPAGTFNVQLTLESLLIDWAGGLSGVERPGSMEAAKISFMGR